MRTPSAWLDRIARTPVAVAVSVAAIALVIIGPLAMIVWTIYAIVIGVNVDSGYFVPITTIVTMIGTLQLALQRRATRNETRRLVRKQYPKLSVVGIMRARRHDEAVVSLLLLSLALLGSVLFPQLVGSGFARATVIIISLLIVVLGVGEFAFERRVRNGLYGANEAEAREIITFILQNSQKIDFGDGGKPKPIISEQDLQAIRESSIAVPQTVQA